jgi:hypothetical protein
MQILIIIAVITSLVIIFFLVRYTFRANPKAVISNAILEFIWICILPGLGITLFSDTECDDHPFALASIPTTYTLWIVFALAYIVSRFYKTELSPLALFLISSLLLGGGIFCLVICFHFMSMILVLIVPVFNLLYLSPFICFCLLFREIGRLNIFLKEKLSDLNSSGGVHIRSMNTWLIKNNLYVVMILAGPIQLIIQAILYVFGQKPDSIISQFTESCGYLLSYHQHCSCGGDHYLCSIAANGNKKLVKPVRFGFRKNERILVNRQLLIANAFENWLEEHCPKTHRAIRNAYDGCNIPVNAWSKKRRFANFLYLLMKPLEWLFLLWLYTFDTKPEDRIAKQYLPQNELKNYSIKKIEKQFL